MYYFKVDTDLVARLAAATKLTVRMQEVAKSGPVMTVFEAEVVANTGLKDFAAR